MSEEVLLDTISDVFRILENSCEDTLSINFIGGEPLINYNIIKKTISIVSEKNTKWRGQKN